MFTREVFGEFPTDSFTGEYWDEYAYLDGTRLPGPPMRWLVWVNQDNQPLALHFGSSAFLFTDQLIDRWGHRVVAAFSSITTGEFGIGREDYDQWVTAMERRYA